eukprot:TRINITY_DN7140_c0_g1_i5.p1 TRINITY_DN7140_c0_g1~~TRINITY_DN7140_c0_g1_i5.p1  ORF type:complete len:507 (-),score=3.57 TRINITY_DN7140_c0_g1_i5:179-1699(-)
MCIRDRYHMTLAMFFSEGISLRSLLSKFTGMTFSLLMIVFITVYQTALTQALDNQRTFGGLSSLGSLRNREVYTYTIYMGAYMADVSNFVLPIPGWYSGTEISQVLLNETIDIIVADTPILEYVQTKECELFVVFKDFKRVEYGVKYGLRVDDGLIQTINSGMINVHMQYSSDELWAEAYQEGGFDICSTKEEGVKESLGYPELRGLWALAGGGSLLGVILYVGSIGRKWICLRLRDKIIFSGVRSRSNTKQVRKISKKFGERLMVSIVKMVAQWAAIKDVVVTRAHSMKISKTRAVQKRLTILSRPRAKTVKNLRSVVPRIMGVLKLPRALTSFRYANDDRRESRQEREFMYMLGEMKKNMLPHLRRKRNAGSDSSRHSGLETSPAARSSKRQSFQVNTERTRGEPHHKKFGFTQAVERLNLANLKYVEVELPANKMQRYSTYTPKKSPRRATKVDQQRAFPFKQSEPCFTNYKRNAGLIKVIHSLLFWLTSSAPAIPYPCVKVS